MSITVVKNVSKREVTLRWNGQDLYVIAPGKEVQIPAHLAKHYAGDWDLKDKNLREEEERRVRGLFGGERCLVVVRQVAPKPKPERNLPPLPGDGVPGEQPFAALQQEE